MDGRILYTMKLILALISVGFICSLIVSLILVSNAQETIQEEPIKEIPPGETMDSYMQSYAVPRTNYAPPYAAEKYTITSEQDTKRQLDTILRQLISIRNEVRNCTR